jgi:hypothetical protein
MTASSFLRRAAGSSAAATPASGPRCSLSIKSYEMGDRREEDKRPLRHPSADTDTDTDF